MLYKKAYLNKNIYKNYNHIIIIFIINIIIINIIIIIIIVVVVFVVVVVVVDIIIIIFIIVNFIITFFYNTIISIHLQVLEQILVSELRSATQRSIIMHVK